MYKIFKENVLFTQLGDEGVVFDVKNNEYLSLNETCFKILKGIEEGLLEDQIINSLTEEYEISFEECTEEVSKTLEFLKNKKIIVNV